MSRTVGASEKMTSDQVSDSPPDAQADLNAAGTTVIFVTHDPGLAALAPRLVTVRDGCIVSDASGVAQGVASPGAPVGDESR